MVAAPYVFMRTHSHIQVMRQRSEQDTAAPLSSTKHDHHVHQIQIGTNISNNEKDALIQMFAEGKEQYWYKPLLHYF